MYTQHINGKQIEYSFKENEYCDLKMNYIRKAIQTQNEYPAFCFVHCKKDAQTLIEFWNSQCPCFWEYSLISFE